MKRMSVVIGCALAVLVVTFAVVLTMKARSSRLDHPVANVDGGTPASPSARLPRRTGDDLPNAQDTLPAATRLLVEPSEDYQAVWSASKGYVDIVTIKEQVAGLGSGDPKVREAAINQLTAVVGVDFNYDALSDKREWAYRCWNKYVTDLEVLLQEGIPVLLEMAPDTARRAVQRRGIVSILGEETPHRAFLPLLYSIMHNEKEPIIVRERALCSISEIPHEGMVESLIGMLETDLSAVAWIQLDKVTRSGIVCDSTNWPEVKREYEVWWAQNRKDFKYDDRTRELALREE